MIDQIDLTVPSVINLEAYDIPPVIVIPSIPDIDFISVGDLPPMTDIKINLGSPVEYWSGYGVVDWAEIGRTRDVILKLIHELPEFQRPADYPYEVWFPPMWLGCPPSEYLSRVEHKAKQVLAYEYWEAAGCPEGCDQAFWLLGEKRYERAFFMWI